MLQHERRKERKKGEWRGELSESVCRWIAISFQPDVTFLLICSQSYKHFTLVNYDSRVVLTRK